MTGNDCKICAIKEIEDFFEVFVLAKDMGNAACDYCMKMILIMNQNPELLKEMNEYLDRRNNK